MFNESSQDDSFMMINIVLLGKSSVGKTALIYRFIKFLIFYNKLIKI